jgi:hypothetical protein
MAKESREMNVLREDAKTLKDFYRKVVTEEGKYTYT